MTSLCGRQLRLTPVEARKATPSVQARLGRSAQSLQLQASGAEVMRSVLLLGLASAQGAGQAQGTGGRGPQAGERQEVSATGAEGGVEACVVPMEVEEQQGHPQGSPSTSGSKRKRRDSSDSADRLSGDSKAVAVENGVCKQQDRGQQSQAAKRLGQGSSGSAVITNHGSSGVGRSSAHGKAPAPPFVCELVYGQAATFAFRVHTLPSIQPPLLSTGQHSGHREQLQDPSVAPSAPMTGVASATKAHIQSQDAIARCIAQACTEAAARSLGLPATVPLRACVHWGDSLDLLRCSGFLELGTAAALGRGNSV